VVIIIGILLILYIYLTFLNTCIAIYYYFKSSIVFNIKTLISNDGIFEYIEFFLYYYLIIFHLFIKGSYMYFNLLI